MRDYTKPHPQAIFKDKPTKFIELYCNKPKPPFRGVTYYAVPQEIGELNICISCTESLPTLCTIALFIIKPKTIK